MRSSLVRLACSTLRAAHQLRNSLTRRPSEPSLDPSIKAELVPFWETAKSRPHRDFHTLHADSLSLVERQLGRGSVLGCKPVAPKMLNSWATSAGGTDESHTTLGG